MTSRQKNTTMGGTIRGPVTIRQSPPASGPPPALERGLDQAIQQHPAIRAASAALRPVERRQAARAIAAAVLAHLRRAGVSS
jgi:hypothetical protein